MPGLKQLKTALWLKVFFLACMIFIVYLVQPITQLDLVKKNNELKVLTRHAATTYYKGPDDLPTGFEYDLVNLFAQRIGVKATFIIPDNLQETLEMVQHGKAHFAAAGLTVTEQRKETLRFSSPYQEISQQVVYRAGNSRPKDVEALDNGIIEVVANSSHAARLAELKQEHPELEWLENETLGSEDLLTMVANRLIEYTIADSNEITLFHHYFPELKVAFNISEPEPFAWAFPIDNDMSLYKEVEAFFAEIKENGVLDDLLNRYYGHADSVDKGSTRLLRRHLKTRLPKFQAIFEQAAKETGLDWRLLAAIGYQESHWNPRAKSPTGVRGIMMMTLDTMRHMGMTKRTDPTQSIIGGSRYFKKMVDRLPEEIEEPDRTWLALAGYNLGHGHLMDGRNITRERQGDPNKWGDVKESLPLLRRKKWYKKTKHGYARGHEAVHYVEKIRGFYDLLVFETEQDQEVVEEPKALTITPQVL